jgi:predicted small secreted protein
LISRGGTLKQMEDLSLHMSNLDSDSDDYNKDYNILREFADTLSKKQKDDLIQMKSIKRQIGEIKGEYNEDEDNKEEEEDDDYDENYKEGEDEDNEEEEEEYDDYDEDYKEGEEGVYPDDKTLLSKEQLKKSISILDEKLMLAYNYCSTNHNKIHDTEIKRTATTMLLNFSWIYLSTVNTYKLLLKNTVGDVDAEVTKIELRQDRKHLGMLHRGYKELRDGWMNAVLNL